jgi:phosphatidylglycerol:prolipoprotein diacylglycerol transferase
VNLRFNRWSRKYLRSSPDVTHPPGWATSNPIARSSAPAWGMARNAHVGTCRQANANIYERDKQYDVLRFLELYIQSPLGIIALNPNTLSPLEGIVAAILVAFIFGQRKDLPLWKTLDILTPGVAIFMVFIGFAHLASGDAFGAETSLPWAIDLWGARRHPTQVYEILAACLVLYFILRLNATSRFDGFLVLAFSVMATISRFTIEALRGDSVIILESIRTAQLMSLIILVGSLILLHLRARRSASLE